MNLHYVHDVEDDNDTWVLSIGMSVVIRKCCWMFTQDHWVSFFLVIYIASIHVDSHYFWRARACVCVCVCVWFICWATIKDLQCKTDLSSLFFLFTRLAFNWSKREYSTPHQQIMWNCYSLIKHSRMLSLLWVLYGLMILLEAYLRKYRRENTSEITTN